MKRAFLLLVSSLCFVAATRAADVTGNGDWNSTFDASRLTAGAGSNLANASESVSGVTTLNISSQSDWQIKVRRSDGNWNSAVSLFIRRTSDGGGDGTISGGGAYVEVTMLDTEFFSGSGDRTAVALQYKLTGMSVAVSPNDYSTTLISTLVNGD
jgi:hypothetical protein